MSPRVIQSKHELKTTLGQFSFVKAGIPTRKNSTTGTIYNNNGESISAVSKTSGKS